MGKCPSITFLEAESGQVRPGRAGQGQDLPLESGRFVSYSIAADPEEAGRQCARARLSASRIGDWQGKAEKASSRRSGSQIIGVDYWCVTSWAAAIRGNPKGLNFVPVQAATSEVIGGCGNEICLRVAGRG